MKRPAWKLPYINSSLMKSRYIDVKDSDLHKVKVLWFRNSQIPPYMLGRRIRLYNGAWFLVQTISSNMIGSKFGQYSLTKRFDTQMQSRIKSKKKLKVKNKLNYGSFS